MDDRKTDTNVVSDDIQSFDLYGHLVDVGKNWLSILLLTLAAWIFAYVLFSMHRQVTYKSTAIIAVNNVKFTSNVETYTSLGYAQDVAAKVSTAIGSDSMMEAVAEELGKTAFEGNLTVKAVGLTNLLDVTVTSNSPYVSFAEVKAVLNNYKKICDRLAGGTYFTVLREPAIQETKELAIFELEKVTAVALAVLIGVCVILFLISVKRNTIHFGMEIVNKAGTEFLGGIYKEKNRFNNNSRLITDQLASEHYIEGVRKLSINIARKMRARGENVLLLTGEENGDENHIIAVNIAIALAQLHNSVILVDTDMVNPALHRILNINTNEDEDLTGFIEAYSQNRDGVGRESVLQLLHTIPEMGISAVVCHSKNSHSVNSFTEAVADVIQVLRDKADYVIAVGAPITENDKNGVSRLAEVSDASAFIIRCGETRLQEIRESISILGGKERLLGCIINNIADYTFGTSIKEKKSCSVYRDELIRLMSTKGIIIDIWGHLKVYAKRVYQNLIWIIAVMVVAGGISYANMYFNYSPHYTASRSFTVNPIESVIYPYVNEKNICISICATMAREILGSDALLSAVKDDLENDELKGIDVKINTAESDSTNIVRIDVSSDDPQVTYDAMESATRNCAAFCNAAFGSVNFNVITDSGIPDRFEEAKVYKKKVLTAMLIGAVICLFAIFVKLLISETIVSDKELIWLFNIEILKRVPWINKRKKGGDVKSVLIDSSGTPFSYKDSVNAISDWIESKNFENDKKVIAVTSAVQNEGTTTTAINIAIGLADRKNKVLLIDGDLRNPSVLSVLGMSQTDKGLGDILADKIDLEEALVSYNNNSCLNILSAGKGYTNPSALWSAEKVKRLISIARCNFDYVVIDISKSSGFSEPTLILDLTDICLFLVRYDHAILNEICEGIEGFVESSCKSIGYIMIG